MRERVIRSLLDYLHIYIVIVPCLLGTSRGFTTFVLPSSLSSPIPRSSLLKPFHANIQLHESNNDGPSSKSSVNVPDFIKSPVLQQVYPAILQHLETFGNPNIPLGNTDGKKCKTLRRLAFEGKLTQEEVELLTSIGFRFNSLEDVYDEADFDECLNRLIAYEKEHKVNYQIPKKYNPDPELGAWVTMIRRIGRDKMDPERREKLDAINFAWISTRKCGSSFMKNYRPLKERLEQCCELLDGNDFLVTDVDGLNTILHEKDVAKWVNAQRLAAEKGNLSDARCDYLDQLPGFNWREPLE